MLLLALDYPGRRAAAGLSGIGLREDGHAVLDLLSPPFPREPRATEYAEALLRDVRMSEVDAVVAYCAAAPIAQEIAALCSTEHRPLPLLLLDGEPTSDAALREQFSLSAGHFAAQFADPATPAVDEIDWSIVDSQPDVVLRQMEQVLVSLGRRGLVVDGAGAAEAADIAAEMAELYLDWLAYLVACRNSSWPAWGGAVHHVISRVHAHRGPWPGAASTVVESIDSDRDALLDHPDAKRSALGFIRSLPAPTR